MTIHRMDNVLIVVDDLDAVIAFFVELGMELEGKGPIEGRSVEHMIGIDDVRQEVTMLRTCRTVPSRWSWRCSPKAIQPEPQDRRTRWRSSYVFAVARWLRACAPRGAELVGEVAPVGHVSALLPPRPEGVVVDCNSSAERVAWIRRLNDPRGRRGLRTMMAI